jgi:hypothetical protein
MFIQLAHDVQLGLKFKTIALGKKNNHDALTADLISDIHGSLPFVGLAAGLDLLLFAGALILLAAQKHEVSLDASGPATACR